MNRQAGGIIYELRCCIDNEWHAFYVGRTNDQRRRLNEHRNSALAGTTLVYQFIREQLVPLSVEWDLFPVEVYSGDHTDQEDEHIMRLLYDGVRLKNMKKGDAGWMAQRIAESEDMVARGITSYRKYREIISLEQATRRAEAKHQEWLSKQQTKEQLKKELSRLENDLERRKARVRDLMNDVRNKVEQQAEERFNEQQKQKERAKKREAAVKEARAKQIEEWKRKGYSNNFIAIFERNEKK